MNGSALKAFFGFVRYRIRNVSNGHGRGLSRTNPCGEGGHKGGAVEEPEWRLLEGRCSERGFRDRLN